MIPRWGTVAAFMLPLLLPTQLLAHGLGTSNAAGQSGHNLPTTLRAFTIIEHENGRMVFLPNTLRVKRGDTVRFDVRNDGKANHEFRIDSVAGNAAHLKMMRAMPGMSHHEGSSIALGPGETGHLTWTFTHAGRFEFACLIPGHFEAGMHGTILVDR